MTVKNLSHEFSGLRFCLAKNKRRRITETAANFMKSKSRIEIITETTREVTLRFTRPRGGSAFFGEKCEICSGELLTLNEAVKCTGRFWDEIIRLIQSESIHSFETAQGEIYVCFESLSNLNKSEKKEIIL